MKKDSLSKGRPGSKRGSKKQTGVVSLEIKEIHIDRKHKYVNLPVVIEAAKFNPHTGADLVRSFPIDKDSKSWLEFHPQEQKLSLHSNGLVGNVPEGDYIVKGVNGEFYSYKPDIFAKIYRPVSDEPELKMFLVIYDFEKTFAKIGQVAVIHAADEKAAKKEFGDKTGIKSKFDKIEVIDISKIKNNYYYYATKKDKG